MDIFRIAQGETIRIQCKEHKSVAELLNHLHDYHELSWPKIAALPAINPAGEEPIPISTISKIAETGIVPKKWRFKFGVGAIDSRKRFAIYKDNMERSAKLIERHIPPEKRQELITILRRKL